MTGSPNTVKSSGITRQIRSKLNFHDEKLWKLFSSRRLELIDTMELSRKKASEQDAEILKCSRILMSEFGYLDQHEQDFVKLVSVAIQSVRRNRKRSTKTKNISHTRDKFVIVNQISTPNSEDDFHSDQEDSSVFKITDVLKTDDHFGANYQNSQFNSKTLPINSLLKPVLPKQNSFTKLPSFASLLAEDNRPNAQQQFSNKGIMALNKLLSIMKKSKTCNDLSLQLQNLPNNLSVSSSFYENVEVLGSTTILSTILYIFEKNFVDLNPSSISYLRLKLNNDFTLSKILKNLDLSMNEYYNNDFLSAQTFKRLIGCCVKDFGFDTVISPLTEIIHEIILKEYPLISKNSSMSDTQVSGIPLRIPSPSVMAMTSSTRTRRNSIQVELKFNSSVLKFQFDPVSSSKPTLLELIENGKDAFNIQTNSHVFLKNLKNLVRLQTDEDVSKIFDDCNDDSTIEIGIFISETPDSLSKKHHNSSLDTLRSAVEVVESRSKENSISTDKIVFQPLL